MKTVGDKFPAFSLPGINEKNEFVQVDIHESYTPHKKDWSVVYFYPKDFTFVCPTEIAGMDVLAEHANVVGISHSGFSIMASIINNVSGAEFYQPNSLIKDLVPFYPQNLDLTNFNPGVTTVL